MNGAECEASRTDGTVVPVQSPKAPAPKTTVSPGFIKSAPGQTGAALAGVVNTAKTTINPIAKNWSLGLPKYFIEFFLLMLQGFRCYRTGGARLKCLHGGDTTVDDAGVAQRVIGAGRVRGNDQDGRSLTGLNLGAVGRTERESDDIARSVAVCRDWKDCTGRERTDDVTTSSCPSRPGKGIVKLDIGFTSDGVAGWLPGTAALRGRRVKNHLIVEIKGCGSGFPVNSR